MRRSGFLLRGEFAGTRVVRCLRRLEAADGPPHVRLVGGAGVVLIDPVVVAIDGGGPAKPVARAAVFVVLGGVIGFDSLN